MAIPTTPEDIQLTGISVTNEDLTLANKLSVSNEGRNTVAGTGVVDDLMETVNIHLKAQFDTGRIPSSSYAEVYLNAIRDAVQQGVAFLLGKHKAEGDYLLIMAQIEAAKVGILKTYAEIELIAAQKATEEAKLDFMLAQIENMQADTAIKKEQSSADLILKDAQTQKAFAEKNLLDQKKVSEEAQTEGISTKDGGTLSGILGAQEHLYGEQGKAFKWNANQKHLKTLLDAWAVNVNVLGVGDTSVSALQANGVGLDPDNPTVDPIDGGMNHWICKLDPSKTEAEADTCYDPSAP